MDKIYTTNKGESKSFVFKAETEDNDMPFSKNDVNNSVATAPNESRSSQGGRLSLAMSE